MVKLLVDIGSTFTKIVAVDLDTLDIISRAQAPSTVEEDVTIGLRKALNEIGKEVDISNLLPEDVLACSSAAGGLRIVSIGFVPELSCDAATRAALGAGAKIVGHYSYELTRQELSEIEEISPDIILLAGGTDGGDRRVIIHNGTMLASSANSKPWILVAGNKTAQDELKEIFQAAGRDARFTDNIMPDIGVLSVDRCQREIASIFLENIVEAKGIAKAKAMSSGVLMPTPVAVLNAARLLSEGIHRDGFGELVVVDIGGATTDVHSIASGSPPSGVVALGMLPELYVKRTVEGDLGVRYNIETLVKLGEDRGILAHNIFKREMKRFLSLVTLPENETESDFDMTLASVAMDIAMERHAGKLDVIYSATGKMLVQHGKNLTDVKCVIGTGGPIVFCRDPRRVLEKASFSEEKPNDLKPKNPGFYLDERYILYAAGLLAEVDAGKALGLMKKYVKQV
jgi:uncharacterized protein (TIGR01319 family)